MSDADSFRWLPRLGVVCFRVVQGILLTVGLVGVALVVTGRGAALFLSDESSVVRGPEVFSYLAETEGETATQAMSVVPEQAKVPPVSTRPVTAAVSKDTTLSTPLSAEMLLVRDWVSRRYRVSAVALEPVLSAAEFAGQREGIDPLLLVAVMAVESRFNPFAESHMGAQGLMQIIPRFHMEKIGHAGGEDADDLFDPAINVHVGAKVLREGLLRYGSVNIALQYYAGALNDPAGGYAQKVLTVRQQLMAEVRRVVAQPTTAARDV